MSEPDIDQLFEFLDPLLDSISHDLKSSLLTLSLSADLLVGAAEPFDDAQRTGVEGLKHGAKEMGRMLDAVSAISHAYREPLDDAPTPLADVLAGFERYLRGDPDLGRYHVATDARVLRELLVTLSGEAPDDLSIDVTPEALHIESPAPESEYGLAASPLQTLFGSLMAHSATLVQTLSEAQVRLGRQAGAITFEHGRTVVSVPLAGGL